MLKATVSDGLLNQANFSGAIYYYMAVGAMVLGSLGWFAKHAHNMDARLKRIEYALFNNGKTGLINKMDIILENQQLIKLDVEVLKDRNERE